MAEQFDLTLVRRHLHEAAGWPLQFFATVTSTMDVARERAAGGAPAGTTIIAGEQTAGRGRLGRAWSSEPGGNLYFTVLLRPSLPVLRRLPMIAPLAVAEAIDEASGLQAELKWPNDVQLAGLKCCGVLLDSQIEGDDAALVLAGIGINVNHDPSAEPALRGVATSIAAQAGRTLSREALLTGVLNRLAALLAAAERGEDVRRPWRARLNTLGRKVHVRSGETVQEGVAEDVEDDGSLRLRRGDGTVVVLPAGEVTLRV